jgi:hypothetical protein
MEAALLQLSMRQAAAGFSVAGWYAVAVFIAPFSFAILYGLREGPQQRRSARHQRTAADEELSKS